MTDQDDTAPLTGDARSLPTEALARLRRQAVTAAASGLPQAHIARMLGVSRKTVNLWVRAYREGGENALRPGRRGRRPGEQMALPRAQQAWVVRTVAGNAPDEVGLPYRLWTRRSIADLVAQRFGITLTTTTIGHYLARWNMVTDGDSLARLRDCPMQPVQRGCAPGASREHLPGEGLWLAWVHIEPSFNTVRMHLLLAVTNRGVLLFLVSPRPFTAERLADFHTRLRTQLDRDVYPVVSAWPVEHFELLRRWTNDEHRVRVRANDDESGVMW